MRSRGLRVTLLLVALAGLVPAGALYARLCAAPLSLFPVLAAARDRAQAQAETEVAKDEDRGAANGGAGQASGMAPTTAAAQADSAATGQEGIRALGPGQGAMARAAPPAGRTIAALRADLERRLTLARARGWQSFLRVKESHAVAFPLHAGLGLALEASGCPAANSGDQWRKAAAHAWTDRTAQIAAAGLRRTLGATAPPEAVVAVLRRYAADEPWHTANLERVCAVLGSTCRP